MSEKREVRYLNEQELAGSIYEGLLILGWDPERARRRVDQALDDADRAYERQVWNRR